MFDVALSVPFTLGLIAAFNPCGFAMLPTYLAYFMGIDDKSDDQTLAGNVMRGLLVGAVLTLGFVAVFGTFGFITSNLVSQGTISSKLPWFTLAVGILMIPLGIAMLFGYEINLRLPKMNKGTGSRELGSVFMFGVSYAVVSLGCTAPIFIINVVGSFTRDGVVSGLLTYLAYAFGMGSVIVFLTMALALARGGIARNLRKVLPYINRGSGVLLVLAGLYLAAYGWWEVRILRDPLNAPENRFQKGIEDLQLWLQNTITDFGAGKVGLILLAVIGSLLVYALIGRRRAEVDPPKSDSSKPAMQESA